MRASKRTFETTDMPPSPSPSPVLPEELIVEILVKLPVKSLLQFRCVCKSWKTLISSPEFVKDHLRNSISDSTMTHQRLVSFTNDEHYRMESCSVQSLFENPSSPPETLSFRVSPQYRYVVGSYNGLVCLCDRDGYFRLWNPSTRLAAFTRSPPVDLQRLPLPAYFGFEVDRFARYGFGYDQVNDKYKVLIVTRKFETKVHTFGTNCWTMVQSSPCVLTSQVGKFVSGSLNWLGQKGNGSIKSVIISFDMEMEAYGKVSLPPHLDGDVLGVLNNCLCLVDFNGFNCDVWLMKKYGVQESWAKVVSIPYRECINPYFRPLCISENGVVLGRSSDLQLVKYNPNSDRFDYPKINKRFRQDMLIYHESLVSS